MTRRERKAAPQPPHDHRAEACLLGCLFYDPAILARACSDFARDDFFVPANAEVFDAFRALCANGQPAEIVTVARVLMERGKLEAVGGALYVGDLMASVTPGALHYDDYAAIVREYADRRRLMDYGSRIALSAVAPSATAQAVTDSAMSGLLDIVRGRSNRSDEKPLATVCAEVAERIINPPPEGERIPTGLLDLDHQIGKLRRGGLYVVAGRPSMGKSALAIQIAEHVAVDLKRPVAFFTFEVSYDELVEKMARSRARISTTANGHALSDADATRLLDISREIAGSPLVVDDRSTTLQSVIARCKALALQGGLDLVVIDYLGLVQYGEKVESRNMEITYLSRGFKLLAREVHAPVLLLAQLNRGVEGREDKRPRLSDLRDSGSIEQDADAVIFPFREGYYDKANASLEHAAEIDVAKNRHGPTGSFDLRWDGPTQRFTSAVSEWAGRGGVVVSERQWPQL